jgi:hypothetical protein
MSKQTRYASYLSPEWGWFAQYCRDQAGFYPNISRKARRAAEISAHQASVRQLPRKLRLTQEMLEGAAK